jgi:hypothetical protein
MRSPGFHCGLFWQYFLQSFYICQKAFGSTSFTLMFPFLGYGSPYSTGSSLLYTFARCTHCSILGPNPPATAASKCFLNGAAMGIWMHGLCVQTASPIPAVRSHWSCTHLQSLVVAYAIQVLYPPISKAHSVGVVDGADRVSARRQHQQTLSSYVRTRKPNNARFQDLGKERNG